MSIDPQEQLNGSLLDLPADWVVFPHEIAAQADEETYGDEIVSAAAYDQKILKILKPVINREPPELSPEERNELEVIIGTEYQLPDFDARRAIARGARQLRKYGDELLVSDEIEGKDGKA